MSYALEMKSIYKSFNGVPVLRGIDLVLEKGEIHALLGENGAGKSTLMNILGGILLSDEGEIRLHNQPVKIQSPRQAKELGIGFIHQELNLVNDLTIYENLFLGEEITNRVGLLDTKSMRNRTTEVLGKLGVELNSDVLVGHLDSSLKQLVEISKALLQNAKIIIMDEPTTSLTEKEIRFLFDVMNQLKKSGVTIIFISHKLKEVKEICDKYTVMRDGEVVSTGTMSDVHEEDLAKWMVGKEILRNQKTKQPVAGEVVFEAHGLSAAPFFQDIDFSVKKGEIIGFTGLLGAGHSEIFEAVFGIRKLHQGELLIRGKRMKVNHPRTALEYGLGYVPRNRKENGIVKDLSVVHNMTLTALQKFSRMGFVQNQRERKSYSKNKELLNIKVSDERNSIVSLSGGNQQKVVLSKWTEADCDLIVLDNPTQGVDVGAKEEIYELIEKLADEGKSFIILSSEINEMMRLCHRVCVMYHGEIAAEIRSEEATEEKIMMYATGAKGREHE